VNATIFNEAATLDHLPKEIDGWRFSYEWNGIWVWTHPSRDEGMLCATPFWETDGIPCEWQADEGESSAVHDDLPFPVTGDGAKDAETYVAAIRPVLAGLLK
jgi:hypothetical protein